MFVTLLSISGVLELVGGAGVILEPFPSRMFVLSAHALTLGLVTALVAVVANRRASVEAAYKIGLEVGERRGRKAVRPVLVKLPETPKHLAGHAGGRHELH